MRKIKNLVALLLPLVSVNAMADSRIEGVATFRERIAVSPDTVFEARLEDVSRADAPSQVLGRALIEGAGNPPYRFAIDYDPSQVDDRSVYAVRASLRQGGRLLFTTDRHVSVLTRGAPAEVEIVMVRAGTTTQRTARMRGEFTYYADAATFRPCSADRSYPVAMEGDYPALEGAYLQDRTAPGQPVIAILEGTIARRRSMDGDPRDALRIERSVGTVPGLTCERALADSPLENTYWRILSLGGEPAASATGRREPNIRFLPQHRSYIATVGCNTIRGSYVLDGSALSLAPGPTTLMACVPPLDEIEARLLAALPDVAEVIVTGPTAELRDRDGRQLLFLGAVALL